MARAPHPGSQCRHQYRRLGRRRRAITRHRKLRSSEAKSRGARGGRIIDDFAFALSSLIVVLGPWRVAIVYAERTSPLPVGTRRLVALGTVLISFVVAAFFVLFGAELVRFFRIDEGAFLFAAGLLVLVFAIRMILAEEHPMREATTADAETLRARAWQLAAYPLAVPLLITPPAIATLVALSVERDSSVAIIAAIAAVLAFDLLIFLTEARWEQVVPAEAWSIASRLLGVLLAAFGATIMLTGLSLTGLLPGA